MAAPLPQQQQLRLSPPSSQPQPPLAPLPPTMNPPLRPMPPGMPLTQQPPPMFAPPPPGGGGNPTTGGGGPRHHAPLQPPLPRPPPPQAGLPLPRFPPPGLIRNGPPPGPSVLRPLMRMPPPPGGPQQPPQPHPLPLPSPPPSSSSSSAPSPVVVGGAPPMAGPPQVEVWFEHPLPDGRCYFSHPQTQKTTWERPTNAHIIPQPAAGPPVPTLPFPPPGASQLVPTRVWVDHKTPEGKVYYYNKVTRQSVWERPKDFELIMPLPPHFGGGGGGGGGEGGSSGSGALGKMGAVGAEGSEGEGEENESKELPQTGAGGGGGGEGAEGGEEGMEEGMGGVTTEGNDVGMSAAPPVASEPPQLVTNAAVSAVIANLAPAPPTALQPPPPPAIKRPMGPRPVASVPIPGTPWSLVHTSDDRTFFFDATSRVSLWRMPAELEGNAHVLKLIEDITRHSEQTAEVPEAKKPRLDEDESDDEEEEEEPSSMITVPEGSSGAGGGGGGGGAAPGSEGTNEAAAEAERKASLARSNMTLEERQKEFKDMLLERAVSAFSTWEKELPKFVFDPRYMFLNPRERKTCFEAYVRERAEDERRERKSKLKEKRELFRSLLEDARLHPKSAFSDFASRYGRDERFKSVEKMREREQLFSEFTAELKRASSKSRDDHSSKASKHRAEKIKSEFLAMLGESEAITERSQWRKMKGLFERDPRCKAVETPQLREEWFNLHVKALTADPEVERQERIQASLKEREREVMLSRSVQEREWGRERDNLRKTEAVAHFKALLVDMVKVSGVTWHDTKRQLRKDHRWELAELLDIAEREKLFLDHVSGLAEKKRLQFRRLLEETAQITFTLSWKKARKLIKEDPRYKAFSEHDHKREAEYDKYLRDKMLTAKTEFRALLRESKKLTHKSYELVRESSKNMKDIIDVLKIDQRYLVLECVAEEREALLRDYLYELHKKGPPPPPTATNPTDRLKRVP